MTRPKSPGDSGPTTILVVDDDDALRKTLVSALKKQGYRVVDADSAERGLQLAESSKTAIQAALLDIVLPDSWGAQLVPALRMNHPEIQILYTSGYADTDPILKAAIEPETTFLSKPFEVEELLTTLESLLAPGADRS